MELRKRVAELAGQRRQYVAQEMEAKGIDTSLAFGTVLRRVIREEAEQKGFQQPER